MAITTKWEQDLRDDNLEKSQNPNDKENNTAANDNQLLAEIEALNKIKANPELKKIADQIAGLHLAYNERLDLLMKEAGITISYDSASQNTSNSLCRP